MPLWRSAPARQRTPPLRPPRDTPASTCTRQTPRSTPDSRAVQATRHTILCSASSVSANTAIHVLEMRPSVPPRLCQRCGGRRGCRRPSPRRLCPSGPRLLTRSLSCRLFTDSDAAVADPSSRKGAPPSGYSSISAYLTGKGASPQATHQRVRVPRTPPLDMPHPWRMPVARVACRDTKPWPQGFSGEWGATDLSAKQLLCLCQSPTAEGERESRQGW